MPLTLSMWTASFLGMPCKSKIRNLRTELRSKTRHPWPKPQEQRVLRRAGKGLAPHREVAHPGSCGAIVLQLFPWELLTGLSSMWSSLTTSMLALMLHAKKPSAWLPRNGLLPRALSSRNSLRGLRSHIFKSATGMGAVGPIWVR